MDLLDENDKPNIGLPEINMWLREPKTGTLEYAMYHDSGLSSIIHSWDLIGPELANSLHEARVWLFIKDIVHPHVGDGRGVVSLARDGDHLYGGSLSDLTRWGTNSLHIGDEFDLSKAEMWMRSSAAWDLVTDHMMEKAGLK